MKKLLCSKCKDNLLNQFFDDFELLNQLENSSEKMVVFIKLCFTKSLLEYHRSFKFYQATEGPASSLYNTLLKTRGNPILDIKTDLASFFKSNHERRNNFNYHIFPARHMVLSVFNDFLIDRKRITYQLSNGMRFFSEKSLNGDEIFLPFDINGEFNGQTNKQLRKINQRELDAAVVIQIDDVIQKLKQADPQTFYYHTILMIMNYLNSLMSFSDVLSSLKEKPSEEKHRSLCLNCRDVLKRMWWAKSLVYEFECPVIDTSFMGYDIILTNYFRRAATISLRNIDSLGVAAEQMSTLQICRRCIEKGIIPGDDECNL